MKKFFALAAIFAATMMSFTACDKTPVDPETPGEEVCAECGKNPCECEPEYVSPITIDGDFADWDGLEGVVSTTCAADAKDPAIKVLKVYADEVYINLYFEIDESYITAGTAAFDIYLNQDNDLGGADDEHWLSQANVDFLLEDETIMANGAWESYDPGMFQYTGTTEEWAWSWTAVMPAGSGIASGAGKGAKYELAVMREMLMGAEIADTFSLGCILTDVDADGNWNGVGCIPNTDVTDENTTGSVNFLVVNTVK